MIQFCDAAPAKGGFFPCGGQRRPPQRL